jgi:hypothetical protein
LFYLKGRDLSSHGSALACAVVGVLKIQSSHINRKGNAMCGVITLFGKKFYIDCEKVRWKWPPIDFAQFGEDEGAPPPTPWREELTFLGAVLAGTAVIRDRELAAELGKMAADIGTRTAKRAGVDIEFAWDDHRKRKAVQSK